jgi:hypothetical protein
VASRFAIQLSNYNRFVGNVKYISTDLQGFEYRLFVYYVDLLGEELNRGVMRGKK